MSDARVWKFCIAVNLTYSLKQFINFETNLLLSETLNQVLNSLQWDEQNQRELAFLRDELDQVLIDNSWTISCIEKDLIDLPLQQKIFCAADKIMILKDLPSRICSIKIKENENSYFLVAALLENGKALYHWKDEDWYKIGFDKSMPDEPHYFYFCEAPLHDIERILNSKCYEKIYSLLRDSHTENESLLDISEASEINQRASIDESKESNEIIEKGVKDTKNQELQTEIDNEQVCKLKLSIKNLQQNVKKLEGSNQKSQNLINSLKHEIHELKEQRKASEDIKNKYESEIANLEKEKKEMHDTIQLLHNQGQQMSAGHNFQLVQLEKLNHDLVYENESLREECRKLKESQIIELPPNRKHGLPNLGNTCYLNSLLQIFSSTPAFEAALQSLTQPFSKSLKDLLLNMKKDNSPRTIGGLTKLFLSNLVQNYPFLVAYTQQDPKEVLNMILSKLGEEQRNFDIFSIVFEQNLICSKKHKSAYSDVSSFLVIPPQYKEYPENFILSKINNPSKIKSFCSPCKKEADISISATLPVYPQHLIFYFPASPQALKPYIHFNKNNWYELYGAICYYQEESFHYTALTKDGVDWNEYNDEHVEAKSINPSLVFLAFYSKAPPSIPGTKAAPIPTSVKKKEKWF